MNVSVVIPVYNNAETLSELSRRLVTTLSGVTHEFEVIFVDDGSRDASRRILEGIAQDQPHVKVIVLSRNFGQHPAICAGFEHASGDTIALMDADLQDPPESLPMLIDELVSAGNDVVYTIRTTPDKRVASRVTSVIYHYLFSRIIGAKVPLNIGTFRAFNRKVLEALLRFREVNILYGPLMFYMGYTSSFVEVPFCERPSGVSSYTFFKRFKLAINSIISFTDIPHRVSVAFGGTLLAGSILYSLAILIQYLIFGIRLPDGITLILLVLCLMLGSVMMFLGIIGSYLFRVYQEVLDRPRYLIQKKINLDR